MHARSAAAAAVLLALVAPVAAVAQDTETRVPVTVADGGCDPVAITVPSGLVTFEVTNAGGDIGEFESCPATGSWTRSRTSCRGSS